MIGSDRFLNYLIQRYAERIGYLTQVVQAAASADELCGSKPAAVIFCSVDGLETSQPLVTGLTNCDIPILVCSSVTDEPRTRELGADQCLLHPLTYDDFLTALIATDALAEDARGSRSLSNDQPAGMS